MMRSRFLAFALAGALFFVSAPDSGSVSLGSPAQALMFKKIGKGFKKFGHKVKRGFRKAGSAIKKGVKKAGAALKKLGKKALGFIKRIKDKVVAKIKSFAPKALAAVKKLGAALLRTVIEKVTAKLGFTLSDFFQVVDAKTGKVNTRALSYLVVQRLGEFVKPIIEDKIQILVSKGLKLVQKPLDVAVSAIVGAVGSIPFAGGALAAGIVAAYSFGMDFLRDSLAKTITGLLYDKLAAPLFRKGLNKLLNLSPSVKRAVEKLLARATKFFQYIKPPKKEFAFSAGTGAAAQGARLNARLKGKAKLKAHDAALKAAADQARAEKDAAHRKRGLHVERNVHGKMTSKNIWAARRRAKAARARRKAGFKGKKKRRHRW